MEFVGMDGADVVGSFNTQYKTDRSGKAYVYGYAESAGVLGTPYFLLWAGSTYAATAIAASTVGLVGVPPGAIASGCVGWYQVRGFCSDLQCGGTKIDGSFGHAVYCSAAGVACSDTAFTGEDEQFAVLAEDCGGGGSTTANVWLRGNVHTTPLA